MHLQMYKEFVRKWVHREYLPMKVAARELDIVEARFDTFLPVSYRDCMEQVGPAKPSIQLLESIVSLEIQIEDIGWLFSPEEMIESTIGWRELGLSNQVLAFASDGSGNMFCLEIAPKNMPRLNDAVVWFFDHEEPETYSLEMSFTSWLEQYVSIDNTVSRGNEA
jgi:hypothetical protein